MRRTLLPVSGFLLCGSLVFADFSQTIQQAELLNDQERHQEALSLLETALRTETSNRNKAEICWRLSRTFMYLGDATERNGAGERELLPFFEKGEQYGQMAMDFDPQNFNGYYWKAGNAGRWGQIKGVLRALAKAGEMRTLLARALELNPQDKGSYYVLGQLYDEVPGWPISFGNIENAVSLGRKSVDLMEQEVRDGIEEQYDFDYYTELAKHLYRRNWNVQKRNKVVADNRARFDAAESPLARGFYYESTVSLPALSDREEARLLLARAIQGLEGIAEPKLSERDDLKEARETLAGFR